MHKYGIRPGDKVLLPACTWMTNVAPPMQLGLRPVFCDVSLSDFSFDEDKLKLVAQEHPDIKMIFVTHLLGFPVSHSRFRKYWPTAIILDDVCESHGCVDQETQQKVGAQSLGATFSFYFGHHMTTVEGGMVSTCDDDLYDIMRMKRSHGLARNSVHYDVYAQANPDIEKSFLFMVDGYNFRNTEIGAVLGLSQIKRLDSFIERRRQNYASFIDLIKAHSDIFHELPFVEGNSSFSLPFVCKTAAYKNRLVSILDKYRIEYRPIVSGNLLAQPFLRDRADVIRPCSYETAELIHSNGIYIGNNQFVSTKDIEYLEAILSEVAR
jgi:CDP-6-deoxy-D-xylo-4-hexulose-3-dehydrase